jgi:hypothetical protein
MRFGFVVADNDYFFIVRQYRKDIKICLIILWIVFMIMFYFIL